MSGANANYLREPQKMVSAADVISMETQKIRNYYSSIASQCQKLPNSWEGENSDIFRSKMAELNDKTPEFLDILTKYFTDLTAIAKTYDINEKDSINAAETLRTDVFNI